MRSVLEQSLNHQGSIQVVITASSGKDFLAQLKELSKDERPQVVITDIHMPGMNGIEVVKHVKALYPKMRLLMLSVSDDDQLIFEAIQSGASGYLLKSEKISVIKDHIMQLVSDDTAPMSPQIATKVVDLLSRLQKKDMVQDAISLKEKYHLTRRENEVLHWLAEGLDYKGIANEMTISPFTVRKHISNIYEKLHVSSKAQVINLMHQNNYENTLSPPKKEEEKYRILLVDDHQIILDSLSMMLSMLPKYEIVCALNDPKQVNTYLADHEIDLLISDISMPGLNGIDLARYVRQRFPGIKILLLTVSDDLEQVQTAFNIGVHGYILKKTGRKELTAAIDTIMNGESYYGAFLPLMRS